MVRLSGDSLVEHEQVLALTAHTERMGLWLMLGLLAVGGLLSIAAARSPRSSAGRLDRTHYYLGAWVCVRDARTTTIIAGGLWGTSVVVVDRPDESSSTTRTGPGLGSGPKRRRPPRVPECVGLQRLARTPIPEIPVEHDTAQETRTDRYQADGRPAHRQLHRRDPARSCAHR